VDTRTLKQFSLSGKIANFSVEVSIAAEIAGKPTGPRYLLIKNIRNLDKLPANTRSYGIFAGDPGVTNLTNTSEAFLGDVSDVPTAGSAEHGHTRSLTAALDVSDKLPALLSQNKPTLSLAIAPLDASGKATEPSIPLAAESIMIVQ